jgi:2-haloacid dehalogenase
MTNRIKALVFDAYGTLYDVHSVVARCDQHFPGQGRALSQIWRQKQLEYTWLKSLMGEYEDFWAVTERALSHACRQLGLACNNATRAQLMEAYLHLEPYPEVANALDALHGKPLAILSNGSPRMLLELVRNTGLEPQFKAILSVDELKIFKPHPSVYALAPARLGLDKHEVGFVSSNYWDAAGAKAFGFHVFWINRFNATADELGHEPDAVLQALTDLPQHVR